MLYNCIIWQHCVTDNEDSAHMNLWSWRNKQHNGLQLVEVQQAARYDGTVFFLLLLTVATVFFTVRWCKQRNRQKRKRPRLKRILSALQCGRIPAV